VIETRTEEGYPPEVIVSTAKSIGCDLITMGTHGGTGLAHLLLGSTAERVVQTAECPVLTVRRPR
jgi:nucleotide-binding universal stress UspA family protein